MVVETSEDSPFAGAESKARKWRGKLFFKDKGPKFSRDEQVDDFLGSHRSPSCQSLSNSFSPPLRPSQQHQNQPQYHHQTSPHVNVSVSHKWPELSDSLACSDTQTSKFSNSINPPKKQGRKGLKVTFSNNGPDIIGEGGDEADLPTKDVLLYRSRSQSTTSYATNGSYSQSENDDPYESLSDSKDTSCMGGSYNGQKPPDEPREKPTLLKNVHQADFFLSLGIENTTGSRLSFREDGDPNSFARRVQAKMRAEEGIALQKARSDSPTSPAKPELKSPLSQEAGLPLLLRPSTKPTLNQSQEESECNLSRDSFWGDFLSSLPGAIQSTRDDNSSNVRTTVSTNITDSSSHPNTPPPPYLKSSHAQVQPETKQKLREAQPNTDEPQRTNERGPASSRRSWRNVANVVSNDTLSGFTTWASQYNDVFSNAAESVKPSMETSLTEWVRASVWWFLKGRADVEASIRQQSSSGGRNSPTNVDQTRQGVLNLAKAWWINQHIVPQHPELSRFGNVSMETISAVVITAGNQRLRSLMSVHQAILSNLRALAMSMKRNSILATAMEQMELSRGIDASIWVRYPFFAPDISAVLSGQVTRSMLVDTARKVADIADVMPLGDSSRSFSYGRMFVQAYLSSSEDDSQQYPIPCVLSIMRDRTDWNVIVSITSQNELVNLTIQGDKKLGPTWADVEWQVRSLSMRVRLPRGFELEVQFEQPDFKMIWQIVEYTRKTEEALEPAAGETLLFEDVLKVFQYMDSNPTKAFPPEPSPRCRIRLFEKSVTLTEGTGTRKAHRGFRFIAVSSPKVKTLSSVTHEMGNGTPIVFGYLRGEDGAPALLLKIQEPGNSAANRSMLLTFHDQEERAKMHSLLLGIAPLEGEVKTPDIPMRSYSIEQPADNGQGLPFSQPSSLLQFSAPSVAVINNNPINLKHPYSPTVLSEHLRIFVTSNWGSATDRINIGPGELKISLDVNNPTAMSILRPPHQDLGISVAENLVPQETTGNMTRLLKTSQTTPIIRRYNFTALRDLHMFQQAITNFRVLFDGFASLFTISRRRMVVPIYKKWEATKVRIQILKQEKIVQLVAFFHDFSHGQCMNFVLKSTDVFESFNHRSGKFGVKIVDAKFALPKPDNDAAAGFVCLDMPEYPGEHDDITIAFDSENDRAAFQMVIPGPVKEPSKMGSLRK
ncbi:hypothetical protein PABG_01114 [Paracoccidioides brasiliensis Pb03]|nr:hypothetical protein PABG_01114 [Paracoccidioides brasiliensis Pb03]